MKKMLAIIAMLMISAPSFAQPSSNPWAGDGDTVKVTVNVPQITEVWSNIGTAQHRNNADNVQLTVDNAGGRIPDAGKYHDSVNVNANTNVKVMVSLTGDIPNWTRFHVIVKPTNKLVYNGVNNDLYGTTNVVAEKIITWDRRDDAQGYIGNQIGDIIDAFTANANTGSPSQSFAVDYAADDVHGMPAKGSVTATLTYTIAAN